MNAALRSVKGSEQFRERARYFQSKLGLGFGVPRDARQSAVAAMRKMELRERGEGLGANYRALSAPLTWRSIGPRPILDERANYGGVLVGPPVSGMTGRVTALAVDPKHTNIMFVGTANGGVWRTLDGGNSFVPVFDAQPTQAIGSIAMDSDNTNPPTVYVGTGEGNYSFDSYYGQGIFKSTNRGRAGRKLAGHSSPL